MKRILIITIVLFFITINFRTLRAIAAPVAPVLYDCIFNINGTIYNALFDLLPGYFDDSAFDWETGLGKITINYKPGDAGDYYFIPHSGKKIV